MYPANAPRRNWPKRPWPFGTRPLGRLRIDVDDRAQTVAAHGRGGTRENGRSTTRERPWRVGLRQELSAMAASQADERSWAEEPCGRRVESASKLLQRAVHVARVRSGYDECNKM